MRSVADPARTAHLAGLPGLELIELEARDPAQFEAATRDIDVLYHAAATYAFYTGSLEKDAGIVRDSLEGIENAMRSAAISGVKKVVLTSSILALPMRRKGESPATEADWNADLRVPYLRAKTLGEREAWRLASELGVKLVTLLPGAIGGGGFVKRTATTDFFEGIMLGSMRMGAPDWLYPYVDIADVVEGHLLAAETDVSGRFILCNDETPSFIELTKIMHRLDPSIAAAPRLIPDFLLSLMPALDALGAKLAGTRRGLTPDFVATLRTGVFSVSSQRAKIELGWQPRVPLEPSLRELLRTLRAMRDAEAAPLGASAGAVAH